MKHTPGPFTISGPSEGKIPGMDDGGDFAILDPEGKIIGEAVHRVGLTDYRPAEANAKLWAVAPKMLAAIKDALDNCETCRGLTPESPRRCARCQTFVALIAKAEGLRLADLEANVEADKR